MCGVGNWGDVGEHVGTKTKAQCYEHYMTAYMNSPFSPLPVIIFTSLIVLALLLRN